MPYFLVFLSTFVFASTQDQLVHQIETRARVQTILITESEPVNAVELRRLMIALAHQPADSNHRRTRSFNLRSIFSKSKKTSLERQQQLREFGISSLEDDLIVGEYVISSKNYHDNPDALNFKKVKKFLKHNASWNSTSKKIARDTSWTKIQRSILLLAQFEMDSIFDESTRMPDSELERWALELIDMSRIEQVQELLSQMPRSVHKASTLYRIWIASLSCGARHEANLEADAFLARDRLWDSSDEQRIGDYLRRCLMLRNSTNIENAIAK